MSKPYTRCYRQLKRSQTATKAMQTGVFYTDTYLDHKVRRLAGPAQKDLHARPLATRLWLHFRQPPSLTDWLTQQPAPVRADQLALYPEDWHVAGCIKQQ